MNDIWMIQYRPKTMDEYIFSNPTREQLIKKYVEEQSIPHLLLYGKRGTGKTSLAYLLKSLLEIEDVDFLKLNASDDNSVEIIRNKVKNFISTYSMSKFKIVFLDEADRLTGAAMDALKSMMEEYSDNARFIIACNKIHKITPEIQSRCTPLEFKTMDENEMMLMAAKILKKEKIKVDDIDILESYVKNANHDFRQLLNSLQKNIVDGKLVPSTDEDANFEIKAKSMLLMGNGEWLEARKILCESLSDDDYEDMYRFLYENLEQVDKFSDVNKWKHGIIVISDYLYRNEFVADKEINFAACIIKLSEV